MIPKRRAVVPDRRVADLARKLMTITMLEYQRARQLSPSSTPRISSLTFSRDVAGEDEVPELTPEAQLDPAVKGLRERVPEMTRPSRSVTMTPPG
jgi:hypothetical protein